MDSLDVGIEDKCEPTDALVCWAATFATHVLFVHDRPWYIVQAPKDPTVRRYDYPCKCTGIAHARRYKCLNNVDFLFIGQCPRCETVFWGYQIVQKVGIDG